MAENQNLRLTLAYTVMLTALVNGTAVEHFPLSPLFLSVVDPILELSFFTVTLLVGIFCSMLLSGVEGAFG